MASARPLDLDALLYQAKWGKELPRSVIDAIVAAVDDPDYAHDRYDLLHILGRGSVLDQRRLMERFLHYREDPQLASIALRSLTSYWGWHAQYLDELLAFALGVDWDDDNAVRVIAISQLGEYARQTRDPALIRFLVAIVDDETQDELHRSFALRAVARALGYSHNDMPSAARFQPLDSPWSMTVRADAQTYLDTTPPDHTP